MWSFYACLAVSSHFYITSECFLLLKFTKIFKLLFSKWCTVVCQSVLIILPRQSCWLTIKFRRTQSLKKHGFLACEETTFPRWRTDRTYPICLSFPFFFLKTCYTGLGAFAVFLSVFSISVIMTKPLQIEVFFFSLLFLFWFCFEDLLHLRLFRFAPSLIWNVDAMNLIQYTLVSQLNSLTHKVYLQEI